MNYLRGVALLFAAGLLSACGGGGGGGSGGVGSTPTPPPPPPVSYNSFGQLTSDQQVALSGVTFAGTQNPQTTVITSHALGDGSLSISYNAATGGYTVRNGSNSQTFLPAHISSVPYYDAAFTTYDRTDGSTRDVLLLYRPSGASDDVPLTYTTLVSWTHVATVDSEAGPTSHHTTRWGVGGFATLASDMPTTGTAHYSGPLRGVGFVGSTSRVLMGTVSVSANFAAQSVQANLLVNGLVVNGGSSTVSLAGAGAIQSNRFEGSLSGSGNLMGPVFNGTFNGGFFGPQAAEMGLSFSASNSDGSRVDGVAAGRKTGP